MNGRYQVGSGRIVTFTHDTPFIENIVSHSEQDVNEDIVVKCLQSKNPIDNSR